MKIAVLGARGFVGSSLVNSLSRDHVVYPLTRDVVDLLDPASVRSWLLDRHPDVIVNAAAIMKDRDGLGDTRNNLGLFMNFYNNRALFGKFINLGSGAEFDTAADIDQVTESQIFDRLPADSYGFGQNIKSRICADTDNFYTVRIFNCFGFGEITTRIFPRFLNRSATLAVTNNRYFDYFSIQDLCLVIDHCVANSWTVKDVNAVYETKYLISEVLAKFCTLNNLEKDFEIVSASANNYTGSGANLNSLGIKLKGLDHGLSNYQITL